MFALGIDPGLSRCGYGAVRGEGSRLDVVAFGHLTTPVEEPLATRLATLWADLEELLDDLHPDVMVVERVLFQVNVRTAMSVGQASGLALAAAARRGIPVAQYSPNEVKLAVAGDGAADKVQVQAMVQRLLGLAEAPKPADRADALALAITYLSGAGLRDAAAGAGRRGEAAAAGAGSRDAAAGAGRRGAGAGAGVGVPR